MPTKSQTTTELPSNDNYEDLPALPKNIDKWLSDVVSPEREPDLYDATVAYTLDLMVEWAEDGTGTFENYAPYVAGFVDGHRKRGVPAVSLPPIPKPEASFLQYKRPRVSSLLPDD